MRAVETHTHGTTTVTLAAHARRGLMSLNAVSKCVYLIVVVLSFYLSSMWKLGMSKPDTQSLN